MDGKTGTIQLDPDVTNWVEANVKTDDRRDLSGSGSKHCNGNWKLAWQLDDKNKPFANLANAMIALRSDPALQQVFGYDEMKRGGFVVSALPGESVGAEHILRPITDTDVTTIQEYLQLSGLPRIGQDTMHQAVNLRAIENKYHPARDYLDRLKWDGTYRLDEWTHTYLGTEKHLYECTIGRMFLISMVARIYEPGCKVDYMLILEGEQGARKSTACAILGGPWFSDCLPDLRTGGKDVAQHLNGKWLIEVAEMSALDKADSAALKAFITKRDEQYRPSFGRREVVEPRQCTFVGTTNKTAYLRDETGGRRFWPIKVGTIDTDRLTLDRDQIFAEAVQSYRNGDQWWPTPAFEASHIKPQQEARYEADAWEGEIGNYLEPKLGNEDPKTHRAFVMEVAISALGLAKDKVGTSEQRRIAAAMERLGWKRSKKKGTGGTRPWIPQSVIEPD